MSWFSVNEVPFASNSNFRKEYDKLGCIDVRPQKGIHNTDYLKHHLIPLYKAILVVITEHSLVRRYRLIW
jgi:hypothetical protein